VVYDPRLLTPTTLVNRSLQDTPAGTGVAAIGEAEADASVRAVFADRTLNFRLRPREDAMRLVRSVTRDWLREMHYEQTYEGVPVVGAGYEVKVLANGRVASLEGRFVPDISMDLTPLISAAQAEDRARSLGNPALAQSLTAPNVRYEYDHGFQDRTVLVLFPRGDRYGLAWAVWVETRPREAVRFYLDAADGTLLARESVGWVGH
jgi:hypothetical protein